MKWAVAPDEERVLALPGGEGRCPACLATVHPKCGDQVGWHWAHTIGEGADCELGEGMGLEDFTGWHMALQTHAKGLGATIEATHPTKKRRADIQTPAGLFIELQHSRIDRDVVLGREADWTPLGPMCWLWDAAQWDIEAADWLPNEIVRLPAKPFVASGAVPIFLDLGAIVVRVTDLERPHSGRLHAHLGGPDDVEVYEFIDRLIGGNIPPGWTEPPREWKRPNPKGAPLGLRTVRHYDDPAPAYHRPPPAPNTRCSAPSFDGTFSGERCGLTATDGTDLCWAHLTTQQAEQAAS